MKARTAFLAIGGATMVLAASACGDGDDAAPVATPDELAASLLSPGDLEGAWSVTVPDDDVDIDLSGVVTEEMRDLMPGFELCPDASEAAQSAATGLEWDAFMQLELTTDDPIQPPDDRTGHMIFLQEFLLATDTDDTAATFDLLRDGIEACLGDIEADEEGPGYAEAMEVPELGDDRYGVLTTVDEAGGWAEWRLHQVIVRDGSALMSLVVTDIRAGDDVEPYFTIDAVGDIARTAVGKLSDGATPGLANPASVYCVEQGGQVDIVDEGGGQVGYCELPDGRRIEEWEFYRSRTATTEP
jgi:putative hemolysin